MIITFFKIKKRHDNFNNFFHYLPRLAAVFQQSLDTFVGPGSCCTVQRGPEIVVLLVDRGPVLQQDLQRVGHLVGGGQVEGGVVVLVLVVDGRLVHLQQVLHHLGVPVGGGHVEGSLLVLVLVVNVSPVVNQDLQAKLYSVSLNISPHNLHCLKESILAGNV